jgi:hypothetical protein
MKKEISCCLLEDWNVGYAYQESCGDYNRYPDSCDVLPDFQVEIVRFVFDFS